MKQLVHLKSTITPSATGAMRCRPLGRIFLFVAHLLAGVALAPVAQAVCPPPAARATYVASYSFTANWANTRFATSYGLDVSTSSSFDTYVPGYQNLKVGNVTRRSVTGLNPSTTYYFRVHKYCPNNKSSISIPVQVMTLSPTGRPVAITDPATYIASNSARLEGTVDPHGLTTTVYFQYGTTISYGLSTASQSKTGDTYQNVVADIGGLIASTTYHFRIVATNSGGTRYGVDETFTTLSATGLPLIKTSPATNVTSSSATLNGSVDPHGLTTNVHFEYGTTTSYGQITANEAKIGNAYQNVAPNISGLTASTTYHFRIVATNSAGTRYGVDETFTTLSAPGPGALSSISSRVGVEAGDNVLIGGFVISGTDAKQVLVRALGPTLGQFGVTSVLQNPALELHDSGGAVILSNDDWGQAPNAQSIPLNFRPTNSLESAILINLNPGAYTAIVRGVNNTTGVGLVEIYDLSPTSSSHLTSISARGLVQGGDDVMIAGVTVQSGSENLLVRALGPTLAGFGISNPLANPTLELHDANGALISSNDNWKSTQQTEITATGKAPPNDLESAILRTLPPGNYTAIVRGVDNTSGVALVEVYALNGSADPHGLTTNVHFQYGTTTSYRQTTPNETRTGNTYQNVAANISGLSAMTGCHFRIAATDNAGTTYGTDRTLTTPSATGAPVESIAYFEQGVALDPRNMDLLVEAAASYAMVRQFPAALKLYDRALDVTPDDPELIALKAAMYQAQGNLQEAAGLLLDVNEQTTSVTAFATKLDQLRLERNHTEAIRLLQARRPQVPSACDGFEILHLAFAQRFLGDMAGAKMTAEEARNTLELLCQEQPDNSDLEVQLALADAVLGERESALREAEHTIMAARIHPAVERTADDASASSDLVYGSGYEEGLAVIQTVLGENKRAISTLTHLLKTPYGSLIYGPAPITPALLRLDPIWDPLRTDPDFQKLCEERQP